LRSLIFGFANTVKPDSNIVYQLLPFHENYQPVEKGNKSGLSAFAIGNLSLHGSGILVEHILAGFFNWLLYPSTWLFPCFAKNGI
jgi:hypothetical protein